MIDIVAVRHDLRFDFVNEKTNSSHSSEASPRDELLQRLVG